MKNNKKENFNKSNKTKSIFKNNYRVKYTWELCPVVFNFFIILNNFKIKSKTDHTESK